MLSSEKKKPPATDKFGTRTLHGHGGRVNSPTSSRSTTPAAQRELAQFQDEIERTKWLSRQQIEIVSIGEGYVLPKIVVCYNAKIYDL